jgi:acyl-CoA dehydrogenase
MALTLSEEQAFLKDTAQKFARERTPTKHFRAIRDEENPECFDREIWKEMAQQGWSGILIPEEYGGSNFGLAGIGVVLEELGRTLTPSPLFATGVLSASLIKEAGSEDQKK